MQTQKSFPGRGKFDTINSTFRSKIVFTDTQRVPHLDGYSKGAFQRKETEDKIYLLIAWIKRLHKNKYFDPTRTRRIEFYEQSFTSTTDELIFVLEPLSYSIKADKYLVNDRLNKYLVALYNEIKSGKTDPVKLATKRIYTPEDEVFQLRSKRFTTKDQLVEFCIKKIKDGHEEGLVRNFYRKYFAKWLSESTGTA